MTGTWSPTPGRTDATRRAGPSLLRRRESVWPSRQSTATTGFTGMRRWLSRSVPIPARVRRTFGTRPGRAVEPGVRVQGWSNRGITASGQGADGSSRGVGAPVERARSRRRSEAPSRRRTPTITRAAPVCVCHHGTCRRWLARRRRSRRDPLRAAPSAPYPPPRPLLCWARR